MKEEIEFSVMSSSAPGIESLLEQFEAKQGIHVRLRLLSWDSAWSELIKVALYGDGPDVSEIGSTWLGDLVAMNSVCTFGERDVRALGGGSAFLPTAWQAVRLLGQPEIFAIPWVTGVRLLFLRLPLFEKAGVDRHNGFETAAQFEKTLELLARSNIPVAWTVPTGATHTTLLNVASWVWGAGGDFVSPDGKRTLFGEPEARAGLSAYFSLGRFLAPKVRNLNGLEPDQQFLKSEETAMTMSGPWLYGMALPELRAQLGVALPPGPAFVGGSHLVIWKHTIKPEAAFKLIEFLMQPAAQIAHSQNAGLTPSRLDALASPPFSTEPVWQIATRGLKSGRSFPVTRSWGLMEDRLKNELGTIWRQLLSNPEQDIDALVSKHMEPLAKRLDLVLGQG